MESCENEEVPSRYAGKYEDMTRKWIGVGAGIVATIAFCRRILPHCNVSSYIQQMSLPSVRPRREHKATFTDLCARLKLPCERVQLRVSQQVGSSCSGGVYLPQGAAVLLSRNSTWTSRKDVERAGLTFENKPLLMRSREDRALADVMILSDYVVKFMIAHELVHIKDMDFIMDGLHDAAHVLAAYALGALVAPYSIGVVPAVGVQVCVWMAASLVLRRNSVRLSQWQEFKADRRACQLGADVCEAGVEWCEQKLQHNKVMRERNVETGQWIYTLDGDIIDTSTHPSVAERLRRIEEVRKQLSS